MEFVNYNTDSKVPIEEVMKVIHKTDIDSLTKEDLTLLINNDILPVLNRKEASQEECLKKYEELYMDGTNHTETEIINHIRSNK